LPAMSGNKIALLPDHVANQIAAGEVVQRPASVVKELLENAIDAGATSVKIVVKDAGKSLIQVVDNGKGMNAFDARLSFERHATSKIATAEDLFRLHTKGFRGEALASIAAVAQVDLKTREEQETVGQHIVIEGGKLAVQEECQSATGSAFTIKNLFFNIPARRSFLKSDQVEHKHIVDELERVAIPHTEIHFTLTSNGNEILNLWPGTLMQRLKGLLGSYIQKELVPVSEDPGYVRISGYVGLPAAASRAKREQYFFVNRRFIRNSYLNHAVYEAYKDLIPYQTHPRYFIFLEIEPSQIDINIHPTKTEIKFSDDKTVYMLLMSAVKRALGKANAGPSLDFESEMSMQGPPQAYTGTLRQPEVRYNPDYNPFKSSQGPPETSREKSNRAEWETLYAGFSGGNGGTIPKEDVESPIARESLSFTVFQLNNKYIVTKHDESLLVVDQQRAHERILYEHYIHAAGEKPISSQQLLFPEQIELSAGDFSLVKDLLEEFRALGFDISIFGKNSLVVNGTPPETRDMNVVNCIGSIIETYKLNTIDAKMEARDNLCRSIARSTCIKHGKQLSETEMRSLLEGLFRCENPLYTAGGKVVMMDVGYAEIEKFFRR
jgi:DNA mismatch repair protein MutL